MRLDHLLSRELSLNVDRIWIQRRDCPKQVARTAGTLLSFEGPSPGRPPGSVSRRTLKTAQLATSCEALGIRAEVLPRSKTITCSNRRSALGRADHRQDMKGTRWMPWHLESMKGVDGCDKPR